MSRMDCRKAEPKMYKPDWPFWPLQCRWCGRLVTMKFRDTGTRYTHTRGQKRQWPDPRKKTPEL